MKKTLYDKDTKTQPSLFVVDEGKYAYNSELERRRLVDVVKHDVKDVLQIFYKLNKTYDFKCELVNLKSYESYKYDNDLHVHKNGDLQTCDGISGYNVYYNILEHVTGETGLGFSFLQYAMDIGHSHLIRVSGKATTLKKHIKNIGADIDSISYFSSWASGPEEMINTLFMMEKKSKKIYKVQEIFDRTVAIKNRLNDVFKTDAESFNKNIINKNVYLNDSHLYKMPVYESFFVYDSNGSFYNRWQKPQKFPVFYDLSRALKVYFKLSERGGKYKIGRATGYSLKYVKTKNGLNVPKKELQKCLLEIILNYYKISPIIYDDAMKQGFKTFLVSKYPLVNYFETEWWETELYKTAVQITRISIKVYFGAATALDPLIKKLNEKLNGKGKIIYLDDIKKEVEEFRKSIKTALL